MKVPSIPVKAGRASEEQARPASARQFSTNPVVGYFQRLWWADVPLATIFWRDMAVVGTVVNVVAIGLAVLAVAAGAATGIGLAIFVAPTPYNIFLVASVWRCADKQYSDWAWPARIGALAWLLLVILI